MIFITFIDIICVLEAFLITLNVCYYLPRVILHPVYLLFVFQVANYGMGGHYETHFDFARVCFKSYIRSQSLWWLFIISISCKLDFLAFGVYVLINSLYFYSMVMKNNSLI